ncbi:MAG: LytTR family transcriptional regulator DNA-binding domain-containing protein [Flavisolibacter sp.]
MPGQSLEVNRKLLHQPEQEVDSNHFSRHKRVFFKKGSNHVAVKLLDIASFYYESQLVFALTREGKKFLVEKNLTELEKKLDKGIFFRANRRYIISSRLIRSFKTVDKVKVQVEMETSGKYFPVIVAQKRVSKFRKWISI